MGYKRRVDLIDDFNCDNAHRTVKCKKDSTIGTEPEAHNINESQSHTADLCTIIFADSGNVPRDMRDKLRYDPRAHLLHADLDDYAQSCDANVIIKVNELTSRGASFDIDCKRFWDANSTLQFDLTAKHVAIETILTQVGPGTQKIRLICVRIVKSHQTVHSLDRSFASEIEDRKDVAYALFEELHGSHHPTIVIGNVGLALSSIATFADEYKNETGIDINAKTHLFLSRTQELIAICTKSATYEVAQLAQPVPDRMIIMQVSSADASSGRPHSAASACLTDPWTPLEERHRVQQPGVTLTPRTNLFLRLLAQVSASPREDSHQVADLLLRPVQAQISSEDNTVGPVDVKKSIHRCDMALDLIAKARAHVGVSVNKQALTLDNYKQALIYLQGVFERNFMKKKLLKKEIETYTNNREQLTKQDKKCIRRQRRGAFKAWQMTLLGNKALMSALLSHGFCEANAIQEFMDAYLHAKFYDGDIPVLSATDRETKRREALHARKKMRYAKSLQRRFDQQDLNDEQLELMRQYESGELERECIEKDSAYGHGSHVPRILRHEYALFIAGYKNMDDNAK